METVFVQPANLQDFSVNKIIEHDRLGVRIYFIFLYSRILKVGIKIHFGTFRLKVSQGFRDFVSKCNLSV